MDAATRLRSIEATREKGVPGVGKPLRAMLSNANAESLGELRNDLLPSADVVVYAQKIRRRRGPRARARA